jgi:hypothetical protein
MAPFGGSSSPSSRSLKCNLNRRQQASARKERKETGRQAPAVKLANKETLS